MSNTKWLLYLLKNWLFVLDIFFLVQIVPLYNNWSGWWESNPRSQLGRLKFYHWTTPALNGAQGRSRTGTDFKVRRILSPVRLPISPPGHALFIFKMVTRRRLERLTLWLKVRCSTNWASGSYLMAGVAGFEPAQWQSQSLLPYRLAIPHSLDRWWRGVDSNHRTKRNWVTVSRV